MQSGLYALICAGMNTHDRELDVGWAVLGTPVVDVLDPLLVVAQAVRRDTDEFHIALLEIRRPTGV